MLEFDLMTTRRPKKPTEHDNDRIARRNLEDHLGNWSIARPTDESSGIEYGQDFLVTIVEDDGIVTSNEFRVQSKVLRRKHAIKNGFISTSLKVETINYLMELSDPVLIHFINGNTSTGYIIWLDEWYTENLVEITSSQKTLQIKIPLANALDANRKDKIKEDVLKKKEKTTIVRKVDILNRTSREFRATLNISDSITLIDLKSKNPNSAVIVTPCDEQAARSLQAAIEQGNRVVLEGKFNLINFPRIFGDFSNVRNLVVGPILEEIPDLHAKIQFLSNSLNCLYEISFIEMKPTRNGTVILEWSSLYKENITLSLTLNVKDKTLSFGFQLHKITNDLEKIRNILEIVEGILQAKRIRIVNLETGLDATVGSSPQILTENFPENIEDIKLIVYTLSKLKEITGQALDVPTEYWETDLDKIKILEKILATGESYYIPDEIVAPDARIITFSVSEQLADETIDNFSTSLEPNYYFYEFPKNGMIEVFGRRIELGPVQIWFNLTEFVGADRTLEDVRLSYKIDRTKCFFRFPLFKVKT